MLKVQKNNYAATKPEKMNRQQLNQKIVLKQKLNLSSPPETRMNTSRTCNYNESAYNTSKIHGAAILLTKRNSGSSVCKKIKSIAFILKKKQDLVGT